MPSATLEGVRERGLLTRDNIDKARKVLTGARQLAAAEALMWGSYVERDYDRPRTAICSGNRYCLFGTLWVGAGIEPPAPHEDSRGHFWATVLPSERTTAYAEYPGLELAVAVVNELATEEIAKFDPDALPRDLVEFLDPAEGYFERVLRDVGGLGPEVDHWQSALVVDFLDAGLERLYGLEREAEVGVGRR
jgi:hypothetical protein